MAESTRATDAYSVNRDEKPLCLLSDDWKCMGHEINQNGPMDGYRVLWPGRRLPHGITYNELRPTTLLEMQSNSNIHRLHHAPVSEPSPDALLSVTGFSADTTISTAIATSTNDPSVELTCNARDQQNPYATTDESTNGIREDRLVNFESASNSLLSEHASETTMQVQSNSSLEGECPPEDAVSLHGYSNGDIAAESKAGGFEDNLEGAEDGEEGGEDKLEGDAQRSAGYKPLVDWRHGISRIYISTLNKIYIKSLLTLKFFSTFVQYTT